MEQGKNLMLRQILLKQGGKDIAYPEPITTIVVAFCSHSGSVNFLLQQNSFLAIIADFRKRLKGAAKQLVIQMNTPFRRARLEELA